MCVVISQATQRISRAKMKLTKNRTSVGSHSPEKECARNTRSAAHAPLNETPAAGPRRGPEVAGVSFNPWLIPADDEPLGHEKEVDVPLAARFDNQSAPRKVSVEHLGGAARHCSVDKEMPVPFEQDVSLFQ